MELLTFKNNLGICSWNKLELWSLSVYLQEVWLHMHSWFPTKPTADAEVKNVWTRIVSKKSLYLSLTEIDRG